MLRATGFILLPVLLIVMRLKGVDASSRSTSDKANEGLDYFEKALVRLMHQRRLFLDGFGNATAALHKQFDQHLDYDAETSFDATGQGRGRRKKLRQMNRTLMAIVMAYSFKFMFLIPTFVGTLILLKFTIALAGFFYALFAAVLGLDRHPRN